MEESPFDRQTSVIHARLEMLRQRLGDLDPEWQSLAAEAQEDLAVALDALKTAAEELRRQNEALALTCQTMVAERRRYRELFDFILDGCVVTSPEGIVQEANCAAATLLQAPQDNMVGRPMLVYVAKQDRPASLAQLAKLQRGEEPDTVTWEAYLKPRHGKPFPATLSASSIHDADGKVTALRWLLHDITEQKRAEKALEQYAERLKTMHAIDGAILATGSSEEMAQAALVQIRQLIPWRYASVATFDLAAGEGTVLATLAGDKIATGAETRLPLEAFGDSEALGRREALVIEDAAYCAKSAQQRLAMKVRGVRSCVCLPLIVEGELIGALNLYTDRPGAVALEHVDIVRETVDQLAMGLQQARLRECNERHAEELEQRVASRTLDLARRTVQLHVAAEVARDATTAQDLGDLLNRAVDLIRERFGFYHAGIFLVDERGEYAVLKAATGDAGRQMLRRRHKLKVGETGIVGYVTGTGQPRIALDVGADAVHFKQPLLPHTRSEMALPLTVGGRMIGALDVQSIEEAAFDEDDVASLQTMADQLAVAIERVRFFEQAQATLEERLRTVVTKAPILLLATDREGVILLAEGKGLASLGFESDQLIGQSLLDLEIPQGRENFRRALAGEEFVSVIEVSGTVFETWYSPARDSHGEITGIISVATDISERIQAEEETCRLKVFNESIVQNVTEGIVIIDSEERFSFVNPAAAATLGYTVEGLLGRHWTVVVPADQQPIIQAADVRRARGESDSYEVELIRANGERLTALIGGSPRFEEGRFVGTLAVFTDITERKRTEERMRQQDRLAVVGQLAGGIAHDFNNILTTIILYAQMAMRKPDFPNLARNLETISQQAHRAADLVRQILDFSRRSPMETHLINLQSLTEQIADILRRTLPENIHIQVSAGFANYYVNADVGRIQQAVMNLAVNARDAMPEGGELQMGLSRVTVQPGSIPPVADMPPGEWVCLSISDTGMGMTPEVQAHLFEPFFTTKAPGKGTGLGLPQVYGIVKQHNGYIGVATAKGQGTTFRIYFPASQTAELGESEECEAESLPKGKGETLLLVEDEERVRELARKILESLGYRVLAVPNGHAALDVYRREKGIDMVITDMVMPEMGGRELLRQLRGQTSNLKCLAITGYATPETTRADEDNAPLEVVRKPFDIDTLAKAVRRVLDAA